MHEFFKPWRSRVGLATLVLACGFMGIWIRGLAIQDLVLFGQGQKVVTRGSAMTMLSSSARDGLVWAKYEDDGITWLAGWQKRSVVDEDYFNAYHLPTNPNDVDYHWKMCGIEICKYRDGNTYSFWRIAYSSIVIPLTLLSAWLLLSKPRPKSKQRVNPARAARSGKETRN